MTARGTLQVRLPWLDGETVSPWMLTGGTVLDLARLFQAHLERPGFRDELAKKARARFAELDRQPRLAGAELEELHRSAWRITLLSHLDGTRDVPSPLRDEYASLLGERGSGWYFRGSDAVPFPHAGPDALLGRTETSPPADFSAFLEATAPLAGHEGGRIVVPFEALGQLPFLERFIRYARTECPSAEVELHDHCLTEPDLLPLFAAELSRLGCRVVPASGRSASKGELTPALTKKALDAVKESRGALRVTWKPSLAKLLSGRSARTLLDGIDTLAARGVPIALFACLPIEPDVEAKALFSALDALLAVQWKLSSLAVSVREARPVTTAGEWLTRWLRTSARADVVRVQFDAELDNHRLAPHMRRFQPLLRKGVKLQAAPRVTLRSRYPLDELSLETAPFFARPYGYGFAAGPIEGSLPAARRSKAYHLGVGARLILSSKVETRTLDHFARPREVKGYLSGLGEELGVGLSDLEALVIERNLIAPLEPPRPARTDRSLAGRKGYLHFVGVGPMGEETLDARAVEAIENARCLWIQDLGLPGTERAILRKHLSRQKVINTAFFYGVGHLRSVNRVMFYRLATRRAIDLANKGHEITMLFSGSPAVWVLAFQLARQYSAVHPDFDLRLTNAISFLDTVFAPTPLGGIVDHLQLRLGSLNTPADVSPEMDCVLGQVGDTGQAYGIGDRPESTEETLARLYPPDHPIYVVGNDEIDAEPLYVETTAQHVGDIVRQHARWYLCLVIPSLQRAKELRVLERHERERARLRYLFG